MEATREELDGLDHQGEEASGQELRQAADLAFSGGLGTRKKARHGDESDYSADWGEDSPDREPGFALALRQGIASKKAAKEALAGKGAAKPTSFGGEDELGERRDGGDEDLDTLWARVREFVTEPAPIGAKGAENNRMRFLTACRTRDPTGKGVIPLADLQAAFTAARLKPALTAEEYDSLVTALDAWDQRTQQTVVYRRFLEAPHSRRPTSLHGIFPKVPARGPTKYELERKAKADAEERRRAELAEEEAQRQEEAEAKRRAGGDKGAGGGRRLPSKEEQRRRQKEEQQKAEAAKKEAEAQRKAEAEAVGLEVRQAKAVVSRVQSRVGSGARKWFGLKKSSTGAEDLVGRQELSEVLRQAGAVPRERDLDAIFHMLDRAGRGRILPSEFCDLVEGCADFDYYAYVARERARAKEEREAALGRQAWAHGARSGLADVGSAQAERDEQIGMPDGMSSIMEQSAVEHRVPPKLMDDEEDQARTQAEIQELLRSTAGGRPTTLDDLLQLMGKPAARREGQILLKDFDAVVRAIGGQGRFSAHEIKRVFARHAREPPEAAAQTEGVEAYIPLREFREKFLPPLAWTRDHDEVPAQQSQRSKEEESDAASRAESMAIDHVLAGMRAGDVARERLEEKRLGAEPQGKAAAGKLDPVLESFDLESQDSRISKPIEEVVEAKWGDPRKKNALRQAAAASATGGGRGLSEGDLERLNAEGGGSAYYRQPESVVKVAPARTALDGSLDQFFRRFCDALEGEAGNGKNPAGIESFVERYGREQPGFLQYSEFKELFQVHVEALKDGASATEETKIRALFDLFDAQSRRRIPRADFVMTIARCRPAAGVIERLSNKVRKGGERLLRAITEELQEADAPHGCNGRLPLNNFQTILADFGLDLVVEDQMELEKRGFVEVDEVDGKYVDYDAVLAQVRPNARKQTAPLASHTMAARRIQAAWRGRLGRQEAANRRFQLTQAGEALNAVGKEVVALGQGKGAKGAKEKEKAKQQETDALTLKMSTVIRPGKEGRTSEKALQARRGIAEFIKDVIVEHMVEAAFCYGESLAACRTIQRRYETRPVTKYLYPLLQEFQFPVQGVLPKSVQTINQLGQIMCLDGENQLSRYDISTIKSLPAVNMGTRPPLKHYSIIDMVCDQASGRIYTLNANWILEIWSIEQSASAPQKRLAVCANEAGKNYINLYYTQTFSNAKPRFLSLQDSNQQILVVNTSCVDGSIVFIDPISFSILKKIQLRHSDYLVPKAILDSIKALQEIFDRIAVEKGIEVGGIFADITHPETQEVQIRDFVQKLVHLVPSLTEEELFKICRVLDVDGSGTISLDEFLEFFGHLKGDGDQTKKAEEELQDKMWPSWIIKEGKLQYAQGLLVSMHRVLEQEHGITAEQAFGIYDMKDTGECSREEFLRVLTIFFGDRLQSPEADLELLMKLTISRTDKRIDYREFCKFLSKRVVRSFKTQAIDDNGAGGRPGAGGKQNEGPLRKEATLTYVLSKAAELGYDLRKIFLENDKNELSVLPRAKFVGLMLDLPLGLNEVEMQEILENDLNFDNYGNVDYTVILNSEEFVRMEAERVKDAIKKRKGVRVALGGEQNEEKEASEVEKVDNTKVVVEDLIYIDDLEILIYTTLVPKTSTVWITSCKKASPASSSKSGPQVVTLSSVGEPDKSREEAAAPEQSSLVANAYQLLAKLKGHKNADPPSICYVPHSCCLITGEKELQEQDYDAPKGSFPATADQSVPSSNKFQKSKQGSYEKHNARGQKGHPFEILIWNLQRDLIELFQSRPPWNVPFHKRINAHNSSIVDMCYLSKSQLVVTASTDQTIKFFDPVSTPHELTDPSNNPHAQMRPGHYAAMKRELTSSNLTFKEVRRIYTGSDTSCFALRCLSIPNISPDPNNRDLKARIEWLVALKLGPAQSQQGRNTQVGFICGYGIERVQIEIPALHQDDIVPPFIHKECEELVTGRRRKLVAAFQQNLQQTASKIFSQAQLQESYIAKVRSLFMQAILQRKELKYVNPEPLREIYRLILNLPDRAKFQGFLASSGCSDKLSVSETFFYLQKFQQIQPLRTTQIEFEKSIQEFHDKHQRQFMKGVKRWPNKSVQRFANHIRRAGLDTGFLQTGNVKGKTYTSFCTRERFTQYFEEVVAGQGEHFSDLEVDSILNDLDPFYTGVIQLRLCQKVYHEEIQYFKRVSQSRPNEILDDIRTLVFPNKRVALQQALASADTEGDGYLTKSQFSHAFQQANVAVDHDTLVYLFEAMSEPFTLPETDYEPRDTEVASSEKVLQLTFFMGKLFRPHETRETDEVEQALAQIKAALVYKGLDFSIIFAEQSDEQTKTTRRQAAKKTKEEKLQLEQERQQARMKKEQGIDMTMHYTRFAQQIEKESFCRRVESLNAPHVTPEKVQRLATFLALNQKNKTIIYLNSWLHHLRRATTAFQEADRRVLPLICSKLLRNDRVFRSWLESCGRIRGRREEEKFIQVADLRSVLAKFGVSYINQDMFIKAFTKGDQVHMDDLIALVKSEAQKHYQKAGTSGSNTLGPEPTTMTDLRSTDYFSKVHQEIRSTGVTIDTQDLQRQFKAFDVARTGVIKVYLLINVLKHNYPSVFSEDCLLGLQFQLECLSGDGTVDYMEFIQIFLEDVGKSKTAEEVKLDRKSPFNLHDYEDLLSKINAHVKEQGLDLMRIFDIFGKQGGFISFADLGKILDLIEFPRKDSHIDLIKRYADESNQGTVHAYEFVNQILSSETIAPSFDIDRWITASEELKDSRLLEMVQAAGESIKDQMITKHGDQDGKHSGVLTAEDFGDLLAAEFPSLSDPEKHRLCVFAVKGSRRIHGSDPPSSTKVDLSTDLVQYFHFERAVDEVIQYLKTQAIVKKESQIEASQSASVAKFKSENSKEVARQLQIDKEHFGEAQSRGMKALKSRIVGLFQERGVSFFDCFQSLYDPLNPKTSLISMKDFKQRIAQLNLPLSVQDHRLLRRIADPQQRGKVLIQDFCTAFETADLRQRRLLKIWDKVATAFFLQGFNMRRAFALFDSDGDGEISPQEFRQGMAALNLHLRYDEIADLMQLCATGPSGQIAYDEFISLIDHNMRERREEVLGKVEEAFFEKLGQAMDHSKEALVDVMQSYDVNNDGTIDPRDLSKVINKLGIMNPDPHLEHVFRAGRSQEGERIDYVDFATNLETEIRRRKRTAAQDREKLLEAISTILKSQERSYFEFFVILDVNKSGLVSRLEFLTGMQKLGLHCPTSALEDLWNSIYQAPDQINHEEAGQRRRRTRLEPAVEQVSYYRLLQTFEAAGCLKIQRKSDDQDTLVSKFRSQLKRNPECCTRVKNKSTFSVEKACKVFDPNGHGKVLRSDFVHHCQATLGLEFSEEELDKLFAYICERGTKAAGPGQQAQQLNRGEQQSYTRFSYKQLEAAVQVQRDGNWLNLACIKIHSIALQKGLSYKRLFTQWRDKQSKSQPGKLRADELVAGLTRLKAGLTNDEIQELVEKLRNSQPDEGQGNKEQEISAIAFDKFVLEGARKLESERSYQKMILQDWIVQFDECLERGGAPIESLFQEHDADLVGSLSFENFSCLNEQLGLVLPRPDLQRIFGVIDRQKTGRVRLDDLKGVASLVQLADDGEQAQMGDQDEEGLKGLAGDALIRRKELNDILARVKETLETRNVTLETVVYGELKYPPNQLANVDGMQSIFHKLDIVITQQEAARVLADVRKANQGRFECSFKNFLDFMTRKKINVALADKGFVDPLIAQCCQHLAKAKDACGLTFEQLYGIFAGTAAGALSKENFITCAQGLELDIAVEDLLELFNSMDEEGNNVIGQVAFVDMLTNVTSKMGGQGFLDAQMGKGGSKKASTNRTATLVVLNQVADAILKKQLQMRQVIQVLDIHKTGFITRAEFAQIIRGLCEKITRKQELMLTEFFERGAGVSVTEMVALLQDLINQQVGGGVFAFLQVQPVIQKIINQLAVDADKFFDEVAYLNDVQLKQEQDEEQARKTAGGAKKRSLLASNNSLCGLNKRLFFGQLAEYGVALSEQDKALVCQVFCLEGAPDKLDYVKLDLAFEGEQQHLYALENFYTIEWQRRIFKKIGQYLKKENMSIEKCFDVIDDDGSQTVSIAELKRALIRFDLGFDQQLTGDKQLQKFLEGMCEPGTDYISREGFVKRFWSAYTYDSISTTDEPTGAASSMLPEGTNVGTDHGRIATGLQQKLKGLRMLRAIQKRIKATLTVNDAFSKLDSGVGFLTLQDFQARLSRHLDLTLRQPEVAALFLEIDKDGDGIVRFAEFNQFYQEDYERRIAELELEKEKMVTHNDIFDHLLKMLKQKGLTLEEMFDQIDLDKNQFIEVDEFHQTLECMGFLITEEQVFELMRQMDDNFDGRISYNELKQHILSIGLPLDKTLMSRAPAGTQAQTTTFQWRDKGIELIIQALQRKLAGKSYEEYLKTFDHDHDGHLTPSEFRQSLLALRETQLGKPQIERILHILREEKKSRPLVAIERMASFLRSYNCLDEETGQSGSQALLIDEDLFVYIVERYDGFSRLVEQFNAVEERAQYISRHTHEINMRGLDMLANQMNLEKIHRRAQAINGLYESTLVLLAGEANRLIRDEAQLCVLDPTHSINTIVNDTKVGALSAVNIPVIESSQFDIDGNTMESLQCGASRYEGLMGKQRKRVEVLMYPRECLNYPSADRKSYSKHLQLELQVHRYLMGAHFDAEEELDPETMDVFPNVGKRERRIGPAASDTEIQVVNELVDENEWINLDDFVTRNGGILNIPLFYHTDAPLFIIRHWAKLILKIIQKVHDVSVVLRCLHLRQVWVSRDGKRIKLGHVRGVGKVDSHGYISTCPDIQLNLESSGEEQRAGRSSQSPTNKVGGAASSSKKTDGVRQFSNACLDNPFIAPETLTLKFLDQSSALDVWSFGMIMYCLLLGKKPQSFYATYRAWYKKFHGHDVDMAPMPPFLPPSPSNFLYDPFSVDFENPFDSEEDLWSLGGGLDIEGSLKEKQGSMSFENFIKCLKDMSYSSLFTQENSKKFHFKTVAEQVDENIARGADSQSAPSFPGQQVSSQETRLRVLQSFAKAGVLNRKNELGLILDLISSCLDMDPKRRPTIPGLINSPLFQLDSYEMTKAVRFSQNVILYRSPQSTVTMRITAPLRGICAHAIKFPERIIDIEEDILRLFAATEECVAHISSLPIDEINDVLTEEEKRRALLDPARAAILQGKDFTRHRVSPNSPLAAQIINDKVIDMLIFLAFRFTKAFGQWKQRMATHEAESPSKAVGATSQTEGTRRSKSVRFGEGATERASSTTQQGIMKGQSKRRQNHVLQRMTRLLKTLVYELHSYSTPMAPFVKEVIEYVVKLYVGEEYELGSDQVLRTTAGGEGTLKDYLRGRSFFQKEESLGETFKSDYADKAWHLEQRNLSFLDKSNHWSLELHSEANKIYKDAISESGMGQSCYPVLNDYISNVTNSFEPSKIFSKQMNQLSLSFLIPMNRTTAYYNELIPITECLSRLYSPSLEKAGKRCALAMIRSVFQTGSSDKIKACLDMRVPKHIIHFLQDSDSEVRRECLLILREISKGLQDDDFEIMGKSAANLKQEYSRRGFRKTAFDQHKAISMASQSDAVEVVQEDQDAPMKGPKKKDEGIPQATSDAYSTYMKRTIALIEKNENERFINFALDLPNLNFLASKRFLKEMAVCFESPVFIAPLTRLLKAKTETFQNKEVILQIVKNLFCGPERVLTAVNSPASDTFMTLLRLLMQNTKTQNARANPQGLPAQMRNQLQLQDRAIELFKFMFEQRRPTIIRDLGAIGASSTLLREAGLKLPELISLPDIVAFFDECPTLEEGLGAGSITRVDEFIDVIKDLRCWVKHFYDQSSIPELTKIKALQRCCRFLVTVVGLIWDEYKTADGDRRLQSLQLIKAVLQFFDWLCVTGKEHFLFYEECGRENLSFVIGRCTMALSQFRVPQEEVQLPLEDLAFNTKTNKRSQAARKYDMFPFTEIGAILQNILYQLVRKDSRYINMLLSEADFGCVFGKHLILEYEFIRHCIDNKIESLVLIDSYVKKNEIRLNTFEYLLRSSERTLKDQLLASAFIDALFRDYISDFREFNIQFSKIDLEFLAFRQSYPVRLECISLVNTALMLARQAPRVFAELVMYARRHFLIKTELDLLRRGRIGPQESTALLLFAIILESNEDDLIHALMQEGAPEILKQLMRDHPSLGRKFPILAAFTSPF